MIEMPFNAGGLLESDVHDVLEALDEDFWSCIRKLQDFDQLDGYGVLYCIMVINNVEDDCTADQVKARLLWSPADLRPRSAKEKVKEVVLLTLNLIRDNKDKDQMKVALLCETLLEAVNKYVEIGGEDDINVLKTSIWHLFVNELGSITNDAQQDISEALSIIQAA